VNGGCYANNLFPAVPAHCVSKGPWVSSGRGALLWAAKIKIKQPFFLVLGFWGPGWDKQLEVVGNVSR